MSDLQLVDGQLVEAPPKQIVRFYDHAVPDLSATEDSGKPTYKDRLYIQITTKGMRDSVSREATESDRLRFPNEWAAYNQQKEEGSHSLEKLPNITQAQVFELNSKGIFTIEALAESNEDEALVMLANGYIELTQV